MKMIPMFYYNEKIKKAANNEITLLRVLNSPFILKYEAHYLQESVMNIIMEYAEGGTVEDKIKLFKEEDKKIPEDWILNWIAQATLALYYIHNKNIMHRDIKPQNMFLMKDNRLKLGDFGVSKEMTDKIDTTKTTTGTPCYMAPEVWDNEKYGNQADIWSLGTSFYEAMAFKKPYDNSNWTKLHESIKLSEPEEPLPLDYSQELRDLVMQMMAKRAEDRPTVMNILNSPSIYSRIREWRDKYANLREHIDEQIFKYDRAKKTVSNEGQFKLSNIKDVTKDNIKQISEKQPFVFAAEMIHYIKPKDIKNGWLGKHSNAFTGKDLQSAYRKSSYLEKFEDHFPIVIEGLFTNGLLVPLTDDKKKVKKDNVYTFSFLQEANPVNSIYNQKKEEISKPVQLSCLLVDSANYLLHAFKKEKSKLRSPYSYKEFLFLQYQMCDLARCDIIGLSKDDKVPLFLNIVQVFNVYIKFLQKKTANSSGGLLNYIGIGASKQAILKIGKFDFSYDDLIHGILRNNKKKPKAWMAQFKSSDPRCNIINLDDRRLIPFFEAEQEDINEISLIKFQSETYKKVLDSFISNWVIKKVSYNNYQSELVVPSILKDILEDFEGSEDQMIEFLLQFFKTKYLTSDQIIEGIQQEEIFINYSNKEDEEEDFD